MRVVGLEFQLLDKLGQTDVVLAEPETAFTNDRLRVYVAYYRPVVVKVGSEVLALEVVDIMLDRMSEDYDGMVVLLKPVHTGNWLDEEAVLEDVSHLVERHKTSLAISIAGGTKGVRIRRLEMSFLFQAEKEELDQLHNVFAVLAEIP